MADGKPIRCAVYTRKSSEEGLEQSFNSLHAQREACEAYILSQKHEGWSLVPTAYDDGGFSGGSMERPGLKALMTDVEAGLIDTVVVYKVDRLTRSLADFAKMVERFDERSVSFVSVTQAFNTTTSMGRLTLNVLLSFAQFERGVTGERIRDKIAASKAKGMWMGGAVPLGYDVDGRTLVVNEPEAEQVRELFKLYARIKAVDDVVVAAAKLGITSKARTTAAGKTSGGSRLARGSLYTILANPIYAGEIGHKGKRYPGQHQGVVDLDMFERVQSILDANRRKAKGTATSASSMLSGLILDPVGARMTATHTGKGAKRYRYYASFALRLSADEVENVVVTGLRETLTMPAKLAAVLPDLALLTSGMIERAGTLAHRLAAPSGGSLQTKTVRDVVDGVRLSNAGITISLRLERLGGTGLAELVIPTALARPKSRLTLVVPGASKPEPDHALISAIAQGRRWLGLLCSVPAYGGSDRR